MIEALRISVTQKCNLNCDYCHKEGQSITKKELSLTDFKIIAKKAKLSGIKKIKITGGEPLLRNDIVEIVKIFSNFGFEDLSIVTNGENLEKFALKLKLSGLNRINIGCDSVVNQRLKNTHKVLAGINAAKKAGIHPIKLNMVVLKGINEHEIKEMINFSKKHGLLLQLIELINTDNEYYKKHYFSLETLEALLGKKSVVVTNNYLHNRKQFHLKDVVVEIVRPFHNKFCENCKRIRMTSDGMVKHCIFEKNNLIYYDQISNFQNIKKIYGEIRNDRHF